MREPAGSLDTSRARSDDVMRGKGMTSAGRPGSTYDLALGAWRCSMIFRRVTCGRWFVVLVRVGRVSLCESAVGASLLRARWQSIQSCRLPPYHGLNVLGADVAVDGHRPVGGDLPRDNAVLFGALFLCKELRPLGERLCLGLLMGGCGYEGEAQYSGTRNCNDEAR